MNNMENKKATFETLPSLMETVIQELYEIKATMSSIIPQTTKQRQPIGLKEACQILGKAKPTVYTLVRKGLLPCYKQGKQLYFYEDQLLEWIESGRKISESEISREAIKSINSESKYGSRPHRR